MLAIKDSSGATPSQLSINQNAEALARYASLCQQNGLVSLSVFGGSSSSSEMMRLTVVGCYCMVTTTPTGAHC